MKFQAHPGFHIHEEPRSDGGTGLCRSDFRLRVASQAVSPFASISANILNSLGAPGLSANTRKEPHTGFEFPSELCNKAKPCSSLAGLGVRAKKIMGIKNLNIYAVGVYVDESAAKKSLSAHSAAEAISKDEKVFEGVINGSFEKSLRLVISYGSLKRNQFLDALQERLEPRLTKAGDLATMNLFKQQFDGVTLVRGTEIVFIQDGTKLITKVDGKERGAIISPSLCSSIFDIYIGQDAVAPDAKATFGESLAAILKR